MDEEVLEKRRAQPRFLFQQGSSGGAYSSGLEIGGCVAHSDRVRDHALK